MSCVSIEIYCSSTGLLLSKTDFADSVLLLETWQKIEKSLDEKIMIFFLGIFKYCYNFLELKRRKDVSSILISTEFTKCIQLYAMLNINETFICISVDLRVLKQPFSVSTGIQLID